MYHLLASIFVLHVDRKHRLILDSALNDRPALEVIVKMKRFFTNYEAPQCKKGKMAETESTSKQKSGKIYESTQRKRTFNSS